MGRKVAVLGLVAIGFLGACERSETEPPAPKPPPQVVVRARSGMHTGGGRSARVYRAERTPTGGWVIYFEAKVSDPFVIVPAVVHVGDNGEPNLPEFRYARVIVRRSGDVQKVSLGGDKDGFRPLNFGFERTPEP